MGPPWGGPGCGTGSAAPVPRFFLYSDPVQAEFRNPAMPGGPPARCRRSVLLLCLALLPACAAAAADSRDAPLLSGYKFVPLALSTGEPVMAATGAPPGVRLVDDAAVLPREGGRALTWAFATGECGHEQIAGQPAERVAAANRGAFEAAGIDFLVSTGGQGGSFTCGSDEGMERFLAHIASPRLVGVDFDIEAGQTEAQLASLLRRIAVARQRHPGLRVSLTLPTLAASDGSGAGLNALGRRVLALAAEQGLQDFLVNLMAMDYGEPDPAHCVVLDGACDMGASAIQAARNLHAGFGIGFERIELTAMIGVNDSPGNRVRLPDAVRMARFVRDHGLAGLHYWSVDRDNPCAAEQARADCSGITEAPRGAFAQAFALGLRPH